MYGVACVRGGGEFGEAWHSAGCLERKQTSFSDFLAVAEWLQHHGYTSPASTAITGSSNGGLLVSAAMVQRPDLFRVALPDVPLCDMLRFQLFTVGGLWTAEYGSSSDPDMLPVLLNYSPLHNVKDGVAYPATLVTTSEHDDRVVPAHAFKFIATLQQKGTGGSPMIIRIDSHSGHGPMSLPKMLAERADIYAFLLENLKPTENAAAMMPR